MLPLLRDVFDDAGNRGRTYRERRVSVLPRKLSGNQFRFIDRMRRTALELFHRFRQRQRLRDIDQHVNVMLDTADPAGRHPVSARRLCYDRPDLYLDLLRDRYLAVLSAENAMILELRERIRHAGVVADDRSPRDGRRATVATRRHFLRSGSVGFIPRL